MTTGRPSTTNATERLAQLGASIAERPYARRGMSVSNEIIRVVLADDHAIVREGLRVLLRSAPDITVVGDAESGVGALTLAQQLAPDVVILDLDMPGGDGATALRAIQEKTRNVRVLILTMHAEHERLLPLLEAGARGYLAKSAASADLIEAIRAVAAGEVYVRPAAARLLAAAIVPQRADESARSRFHTLSDREKTILRSVSQGYSGAEIARRLGISSKTVDAYKRRVEEKLGFRHRTDYVSFAIEAGILGQDEG
ncbi:MAG: response regulator receiver [Gemmatimonadales bacterium]|jgi:DNA-binding NarL/FixJ family response regulator|nr:response regulator receiver [Gemmatimonadales bacterium]